MLSYVDAIVRWWMQQHALHTHKPPGPRFLASPRCVEMRWSLSLSRPQPHGPYVARRGFWIRDGEGRMNRKVVSLWCYRTDENFSVQYSRRVLLRGNSSISGVHRRDRVKGCYPYFNWGPCRMLIYIYILMICAASWGRLFLIAWQLVYGC